MIDIYPVKEDYIHDYEIAAESELPVMFINPGDDPEKIKDQCINLAAYTKNLEAEAVALKAAADAILDRMNAVKKKSMRCKEIIHTTMEYRGIDRITDSPYFAIKIKKNPPSMVIINSEEIPPEYKSERMEIVIDNAQIKADLSQGLWVPGASLETKTRLEIK